ncbi:hypothetical protein NDGK_02656 [Clostridiales bacterium CHKCI001]|nr:hypothetical protein NDGK_02656 [Clostridiales bacterium CHKCI001]
MNKNNISFYLSVIVFALAIITTFNQFFSTIKGLCIYIPYFTILCTPAILVFRSKLRSLHKEMNKLSVQ